MSANIPFNWQATTVAAGTFNISSTGYVQGTFVDDPATRNELAAGIVSTAEVFPIYGGIGIRGTTPPNPATNAPSDSQGGIISRATTVTANATGTITGFTVYNQMYGMTITPQ